MKKPNRKRSKKMAATPRVSKTGRKNTPRHTKGTITVGEKSIATGLSKSEIIDRLEGFSLPTEPFTVRQAELQLGASHWFFTDYIKSTCQIAGEADSKKRGKRAVLYIVKK